LNKEVNITLKIKVNHLMYLYGGLLDIMQDQYLDNNQCQSNKIDNDYMMFCAEKLIMFNSAFDIENMQVNYNIINSENFEFFAFEFYIDDSQEMSIFFNTLRTYYKLKDEYNVRILLED